MENINMQECALTTYDNPYNPFVDFDNWFLFDVTRGYNSCELLARFYEGNDDTMSDTEQLIANEKAIDKVISLDYECIYKKVYKNASDKKINFIR